MTRFSIALLALLIAVARPAPAQLFPADGARIDQLGDIAAVALRTAQGELLTALALYGLDPQTVHDLTQRISGATQLRDAIMTLTQLYGLLSLAIVQQPNAGAAPTVDSQLDQLGSNAADAIGTAEMAILEVLTIRGLDPKTTEIMAARVNANASLREKLLTLIQLQRLLQPSGALLPIPPELAPR